ncbi:LytR C-terminal domain-containing protein [Arthrobacter sp. N199823]|uniref:LytR C-terminal domain-containing protein n=1 Tax=Arthrobacter sp. N199823 TaxID=2058895 RepID=UPI000CE56CCD|nr:LytR C-terminal domain-containing protein [Arthrobacter sp. N199823]
MSNYPRDEFDAIEEHSARHGVHRSSLDPQRRSLMPLMVVGVVALCVGLLAFFIMPKFFTTTTTPPVAEVTQSSTAAPSTTAAPATPSAAPTTAPVETPTPTPTPEPTPTAVVDKTVPVAIYNAAGVSGLAATYAGRVQADGWMVSQSANWAGQPQATSVIFYSDVEQKGNAEALSALLGIPTLLETPELGVPLAVVLGPGA